MIIIDEQLNILEKKHAPIRVGLVGAGFAARGFALQLARGVAGMRLAVIANRTLTHAREAYTEAGYTKNIAEVTTPEELQTAVRGEQAVITSNPDLLCSSPDIDVVVEATGEVEFGARVITKAIENKKHVVLINAELDATIGPLLKKKADGAGVVYTQMDGDQPAVLMNLYRRVAFLGCKPVLAGNIKSLLDHYRTPETQKEFAEKSFQRPKMITSFADGTKIAMEMATVANATGFRVGRRGMYGPTAKHPNDAIDLFSHDEMLNGGLVDYILGAEPSFGVFVIGYNDNPLFQRYMKVYKMGDGPFYVFYTPFHLSPLETPATVARAVLFKDAALAPKGGPVADVIAVAKRDIKTGEILDGIGGFTCYGLIDNYKTAREKRFLPMGLTDGCKAKRDIKKDEPISFNDVEMPEDSIACALWQEQEKIFT
ncbi:MAG: NAD(P)-dependent oxidoreductase [Candidatus Niyogibacteria bacterium CG10_big_fil_rev_8_21_14_0_10_46_36]|uniref:NAD(P)-dependent oxidoreductase n=1 Tax=Candidatus Niyogibacteria bacterium CG10_big_fil_rev_8_21_14_0_10_46_36 TaxID=1974726 RepID=A0A2H0TEA4_9BACT|nr:MAG: NAD(P)-dependent oxidoreductase [Candidatus Niyogibacteria bacterium CG10_big_fil_rev_8_21_14_0_10_46_36]